MEPITIPSPRCPKALCFNTIKINEVERSFTELASIRGEPNTNIFLTALLLQERWKQHDERHPLPTTPTNRPTNPAASSSRTLVNPSNNACPG